MLNMQAGEGLATTSGPVKLRVSAADPAGSPAAGAPFRIPMPSDAGADGSPANGFRPGTVGGNVLPPGDGAAGTLRNPGHEHPTAVSTQQLLEQAAAGLAGGLDGTIAGALAGDGTAAIGFSGGAGDAAAGNIGAGVLPATDLLPDLELEFPAAPLQPGAAGLTLAPPPLDGTATTIATGMDAARPLAGALPTAGGPQGLPADTLTGMPAAPRMPEWLGGAPGSPGGNSSAGLSGLPGAGTTASAAADMAGDLSAELRGDRMPGVRMNAETAGGATGRPVQPAGLPLMPTANGPLAAAPGLAAQAVPAGTDALAGLRQAMADLARDGGASDRRPAPEPLTRTDGTGFLSTLGLTTASQGAAGDRPVFLLPSPPGAPEFADQMAERVVWMAGQKLDRAQIRLNPAHLGPISVDVSVGEDGANVTFTAQHAMTRDALEQALPRLREMFSSSGLALAGADVSGHGADTHRGGQDTAMPGSGDALTAAGTGGDTDAEAVAETPLSSRAGGRGLIDTYV